MDQYTRRALLYAAHWYKTSQKSSAPLYKQNIIAVFVVHDSSSTLCIRVHVTCIIMLLYMKQKRRFASRAKKYKEKKKTDGLAASKKIRWPGSLVSLGASSDLVR